VTPGVCRSAEKWNASKCWLINLPPLNGKARYFTTLAGLSQTFIFRLYLLNGSFFGGVPELRV